MHTQWARWFRRAAAFWLATFALMVKAQVPDCAEFTLSAKAELALPKPFLLSLQSASPCLAVGDALLGNDGRRYLIAYNTRWQPIDTIQTGSDSANRHLVVLNERQAVVLNADITFGTLTYTFCDFGVEGPYRQVSQQTNLALPGLFFEAPELPGMPPREQKSIYSQTVESVGRAPGGLLLVVRGWHNKKPRKPDAPIERKLLFLKLADNGIISPQRFIAVEMALNLAWPMPKRTLPRVPLFDPALPQLAAYASPFFHAGQLMYYVPAIGYVATDTQTGQTQKIVARKGSYDPYLLHAQNGDSLRTLEYRQGKTQLEGMEGGYGRKSIYSLVGIYDYADAKAAPLKLPATDAVFNARPQLFWHGRWHGINKLGERVAFGD